MTTWFGLDIGATKTCGIALADDGRVLAELREPTDRGADGVVRTAARVAAHLREATGAEPAGAIGVGVPGLVDVVEGTVRHAVNLGLDGDPVPLRDLLATALGHEVVLENDVNAAALGSADLLHARDLAFLSIGTGLAAGLVLDGQVRHGRLGAAGEIGHLSVDPSGLLCACGQRGCLETVASGAAVTAAWPSSGRPSAQALFAAAEAGDPKAVDVRAGFAAGVAAAVRILALAVDPDLVVLGGGVANLGDPLRAVVASALDVQAASSEFLASLALADRVVVTPPGRPVAAIGAALLARS